jgi:release factor glutamine methyltransferase
VIQLGEALRRAVVHLEEKGSPTPRLDAELLFAHALDVERIQLYVQHERLLTAAELERCRELLRRRAAREPVAYILGRWGFRDLDLAVDARVLVPRPETEHLVERCLALLEGMEAPAVLDIGTGSGAVALSVAAVVPAATVTASDVSPEALALAGENAGRLGLDVELVQSDLFAGLAGRRFDLIASNPPYVGERELAGLEPEVREWEPRQATVAGPDGLDVFRRLLPDLSAHLAPGGAVAFECGAGQTAWLAGELEGLGYRAVLVERDLGGIERVVSARWS